MRVLRWALTVILASAGLTVVTAGSAAAAPDPWTALKGTREIAYSTGRTTTSAAFTMHNKEIGGSYCLDNFASGNGANNSKVGFWACNGGATELWMWRVIPSITNLYDTELINLSANRCLDYPASAGDNRGFQLNVYDCLETDGQLFFVTESPDHPYTFEMASAVGDSGDLVLDPFTSTRHGNGSPVGLWTRNYSTWQLWT